MKRCLPLLPKKPNEPPPTQKTIFLLKPQLSSPPTNFLKDWFTFRFHYFSTYRNLASTPITMATKKPFAKAKNLTLSILIFSPHSSSYFNALQYTLVVLLYSCDLMTSSFNLISSIFTEEVLFLRILSLTFLFLLHTFSWGFSFLLSFK